MEGSNSEEVNGESTREGIRQMPKSSFHHESHFIDEFVDLDEVLRQTLPQIEEAVKVIEQQKGADNISSDEAQEGKKKKRMEKGNGEKKMKKRVCTPPSSQRNEIEVDSKNVHRCEIIGINTAETYKGTQKPLISHHTEASSVEAQVRKNELLRQTLPQFEEAVKVIEQRKRADQISSNEAQEGQRKKRMEKENGRKKMKKRVCTPSLSQRNEIEGNSKNVHRCEIIGVNVAETYNGTQKPDTPHHTEASSVEAKVRKNELLRQTLPHTEEAVKVIEQQKSADQISLYESQAGQKRKRMQKENGEKKMKKRVCNPSLSQRNEIESDSKNVYRCEIIGVNVAETYDGTQKPLTPHHTEASSVEAQVGKTECLRHTLPRIEEAVKVIEQHKGVDQISSDEAQEGKKKNRMEKENGKRKMKKRVCTPSLSQRNEIEDGSKNVHRCEIIGVNVAETYNGTQKPLIPHHTEASSVEAQVRKNELPRQTLRQIEVAVKLIEQQKGVDQISSDEAQEGQKKKRMEKENGKKKMKKSLCTPSLSQRNDIEGDSKNVHRCEIIGVNVAETYNGTQNPLTSHHTEASSVKARVRKNELPRQALPQIEEAVKVFEQQKEPDQISSDEAQEGQKKRMEKENGKRKMKKRVCTPSLSQRNEIEDDSKNVQRCEIIGVNVAETYNGTQKPLIPHHTEASSVEAQTRKNELPRQTLPQIEVAVKVIEQQKGADQISSDEAQEGQKMKRMEKEKGKKKMKKRLCIPSLSQRNEIEGDSKNVHRCVITRVNVAETYNGTQKPLTSHHTEASSFEAQVKKNHSLRQTLPHIEEAVKVIEQQKGADQISSDDAQEGQKKKRMKKENGKKKMKKRVCTPYISQKNEIECDSKNVHRCEIMGINAAETYNGTQKPLPPHRTEASPVEAQVSKNEHPKKKRKIGSKALQALSPPERKRFEPRSHILSREGSNQVLGGNGSQPIMPNGNQSKVLTPNEIWEMNHQYFLMEASLQMLAFMKDLYIAILHNLKAAIKQTHH